MFRLAAELIGGLLVRKCGSPPGRMDVSGLEADGSHLRLTLSYRSHDAVGSCGLENDLRGGRPIR